MRALKVEIYSKNEGYQNRQKKQMYEMNGQIDRQIDIIYIYACLSVCLFVCLYPTINVKTAEPMWDLTWPQGRFMDDQN